MNRAGTFPCDPSTVCGNLPLSLRSYRFGVVHAFPECGLWKRADMRVTRVVKAVYRLALVALGAALLAGCNGETGLDTNARAYAPIPEATLESFRAKPDHAERPRPHPRLQEGSGDGDLEAELPRSLRLRQDLPDVPLVRPARPEGPGRRPAGAGGLLHDFAGLDEPELGLLSVVQRRLSERLRPCLGPHRPVPSWSTGSVRRPAASR